MIYKVVLVSTLQQGDSVIHIHISILFQMLFLFRLLHNIKQSSLCYNDRSLLIIHFKYSCMYMSTPNSLTIPSTNSSLPDNRKF